MKVADSHAPKGPGIIPLQHHGGELTKDAPHNRSCLLAFRIINERDNMGHYEEDPETRGDLLGAIHWGRNTRPTSGWAFSWGAITSVGGAGPGGAGAIERAREISAVYDAAVKAGHVYPNQRSRDAFISSRMGREGFRIR